jgi:hypothetical protein
MEMQNIVIFALIGAVCLFIITGGLISMTSDIAPSPETLASGAAVGGVLGATVSYLSSESLSVLPDLMSGFGDSTPDMKVGLPSF